MTVPLSYQNKCWDQDMKEKAYYVCDSIFNDLQYVGIWMKMKVRKMLFLIYR